MISSSLQASERLQVLLADYEHLRDDDRGTQASLATIVGTAVALITLLGGTLGRACQFQGEAACQGAERVPDLLLAAAPLAPILLMGYFILLTFVSTLRSFYLHAVEREIQSHADAPMRGLPIPPMSYYSLHLSMVSQRRGDWRYLTWSRIIFISLILAAAGLALYTGSHVERPARVAMALVYIPLLGLLIDGVIALGPRGRGLFKRLLGGYVISHHIPETTRDLIDLPPYEQASAKTRSLLSYLLVPRPKDSAKLMFLPLGYLVGAYLIGGGFADTWEEFLVVFAGFEFGLYSARYQFNDLLGAPEDEEHPRSDERSRIPLGDSTRAKRRAILSVLLAIPIRSVVGIAAVAWAAGTVLATIATIGVLFTAWVYEALRVSARECASDRKELTRPSRADRAIWYFVGAGYALRFGLGLAVAGVAYGSTAFLTAIPVLWCFGAMFVTATWALEALTFCAVREPYPDVRSSVTTMSVDALDSLRDKPHLAALLGPLGMEIATEIPVDEGFTDDHRTTKRYRALAGYSTPGAAWNWTHVLLGVLSFPFGIALAETGWTVEAGLAISIALVGNVGSVAARSYVRRWLYFAVASVGVAAILGSSGDSSQLILAVPWLATGLYYLWIVGQAHTSLVPDFREIGSVVVVGAAAALRKVLGARVFALLALDVIEFESAGDSKTRLKRGGLELGMVIVSNFTAGADRFTPLLGSWSERRADAVSNGERTRWLDKADAVRRVCTPTDATAIHVDEN